MIVTEKVASPRPETQTVGMTGMQRMASKMWAPWIAMGLMIVVISFVIGLVLQNTEATYYANSKEAREVAVAGIDIVQDKGFIEVTKAWVPGFKFLGLGMMLGGITFLLATILGNLRVQGGRVQQSLSMPVVLPTPPITARMFPMFMMAGMMILNGCFWPKHMGGDDRRRLLEPLDCHGVEHGVGWFGASAPVGVD